MPRFFFDTYNGEIHADDEGEVLPDAHAARSIADTKLLSFARDEVARGCEPALIVTLRDENNTPLY